MVVSGDYSGIRQWCGVNLKKRLRHNLINCCPGRPAFDIGQLRLQLLPGLLATKDESFISYLRSNRFEIKASVQAEISRPFSDCRSSVK